MAENVDTINLNLGVSQLTFEPIHSSTQLDDIEVGDDDNDSSRNVVTKYKQLIRELLEKEIDPSNLEEFTCREKEALEAIMKKAEELFDESKTSHQMLFDARLIRHLTRIVRQFAEELSLNMKKFHPTAFADKLTMKMGQGFTDSSDASAALCGKSWTRFSYDITAVFNRPPYIQSMYSAFPDDIPKPKKEKAPRQKACASQTEATKANVVDFDKVKEDRNSSNETDKQVVSVFKQLVQEYQDNGKRAVCYFSFVIDPDSFGRSVENIFYVSFLVKEGKAKVFYDEETGLPRIQPKKASQHHSSGHNLTDKKQVIVSFSMDDWSNHKTALRLKNAMIKR